MAKPNVAATAPMPVEVEAGKTYFWCACGMSNNQPFCDGSHKGSGFAPVQFQPAEDGKVFFCCCKYTGSPPTCDGTHKTVGTG